MRFFRYFFVGYSEVDGMYSVWLWPFRISGWWDRGRGKGFLIWIGPLMFQIGFHWGAFALGTKRWIGKAE